MTSKRVRALLIPHIQAPMTKVFKPYYRCLFLCSLMICDCVSSLQMSIDNTQLRYQPFSLSINLKKCEIGRETIDNSTQTSALTKTMVNQTISALAITLDPQRTQKIHNIYPIFRKSCSRHQRLVEERPFPLDYRRYSSLLDLGKSHDKNPCILLFKGGLVIHSHFPLILTLVHVYHDSPM